MDEKQARHLLAEMQTRLARSSYDALEIQAGSANPHEVRAAFFRLTKTFHPQKFARMTPDIQKLANEVFLSLRAAHDSLKGANKKTGNMPVVPKPVEARPPARPSPMPGRSSAQIPAQRPPITTRLTPAGGVPVVQQAPVDLAAIEDLLQKQQWEPARKQLNALIAKDPKPRYKALLQYSFGREAQLARKVDEARDKLLDALEIDSELLIAQKALAELHTRRK